jgi:hypothetical protein
MTPEEAIARYEAVRDRVRDERAIRAHLRAMAALRRSSGHERAVSLALAGGEPIPPAPDREEA